ncbi:LysM peptidoglycan-binding domain-containing protein [Ideonella sp. 4Y11]|uniref:LysM peptidoglycan-binding domain-containing protein n=1 Tax=Ideonella aquatica TaxID=2824119 RepID=A0A940YFE6_9BURK|nr:LysM domain-containing protein [Ideonella aquatica]MBQ0959223.1 LysM peptidoglycan-binding domain-containing protein [Ideonella aquatica]
MSRSLPRLLPLLCALGLCGTLVSGPASAVNYPVTDGQRSTAQKVAQAGVPLSELAPNAPDSHTVKRGDTLWGISKIFLKSPWRWPELWGMNLEQIRNPHLIYPGQVLWLDKSSGRAVLRVGRPVESAGDGKLSPRVRPEALQDSAIGSVPMSVIGPFLTESVVLEANNLIEAPRIVATQEGRVLLSRGETAYVRGDVSQARTWQLYREPKPLTDPLTGEVLGFEARHVGVVEQVRAGEVRASADGKTTELVPATFTVASLREEATVGDRLAPQPPRDFEAYAPHAPAGTFAARIVSVHGDGLNAGQNQIVSINRGAKDGMERGHVLALWRAGQTAVDTTTEDRAVMRLPDTRVGELFVFRVFDRVSYALVLQSNTAVTRGDLVTQP